MKFLISQRVHCGLRIFILQLSSLSQDIQKILYEYDFFLHNFIFKVGRLYLYYIFTDFQPQFLFKSRIRKFSSQVSKNVIFLLRLSEKYEKGDELSMEKVAILGAGTMETAIAIYLAKKGH